MLQRTLLPCQRRLFHSVRPLFNKNPLIHENGLYYGKFTKEEYDKAKQFVTTQYEKLEKDIKGTEHVREKVGKMPQFPSRGPARGVANLSDFFQEMIKTTGPIPLSAYMRQCLTHPEFGYYTTRNPLDALGGDFITSPEISSVFGEMIGIWLYSVWTSQGSPKKIRIVEFGPGKGTLMHDVVIVFNKFVAKSAAAVDIEVVMVEASHVLRKEQHKLLCNDNTYETTSEGYNTSTTKWNNKVTWVDTEKDIVQASDTANYVLAHEFFDALPIKSFTKTEHGWREHVVEHTSAVLNTQPKLEGSSPVQSEENEELNTDFHLTVSPKETPSSAIPTLSSRYRDLPEGSRVEICPDAELYLSHICNLVNGYSDGSAGAALIIDYGPADEVPSNSLRGIYQHKFVSPFYKPGDVDLSIDVDFANLKDLAEPHLSVYGPVEQGDWLHEIGVGYRFDQLIKAANSMANKESIYDSYIRLTSKDEKGMGKIYKFLGLLPHKSTKPIGFGM
ncbi:uncharacterized protein CXQ87_001641 [Candidozyma duobushaemuli]|uniref:Protein arginine methyltransferase NDUFAF7 n=2 Tax=Candidozyma TaxID=3303203 RepID=A0ABX8I5B2_9ASCO|nr:uncharacterized protein CXQ87_001641 [[Candida] duobushaemulonis]PVH13535.1 hypothetical protein CXQ87_001641 [[Candida] duobushaemulonis]QWU88222.1 hypothetical protein CA3LBN_002487 [[Candida] haemuloni]